MGEVREVLVQKLPLIAFRNGQSMQVVSTPSLSPELMSVCNDDANVSFFPNFFGHAANHLQHSDTIQTLTMRSSLQIFLELFRNAFFQLQWPQ
jgi:hypothetical protein